MYISDEAVAKYALIAVNNEAKYPHHGRLCGYDRQAAMDDVLNHFEGLTLADEPWIREAVAEAEEKLGVTC